MFQAIEQSTREDHPFDRALHEGFRLAEKGLDEGERAQVRRARVRLLLYPALEPEERARLEEELAALRRRSEECLTPEERLRLSMAGEADLGDRATSDLERSLRAHVESAELRLTPASRDRLLRARRAGPALEARGGLEAEKAALESKAWAPLREEERVALEFFEDALPITPEERDLLARERAAVEALVLERLTPAERARLEAAELQRRAEASLEEAERERLRALPERQAEERELMALRARGEAALTLEQRTQLLRARLAERRDAAEQALSAAERRTLEQARLHLRTLREREELEQRAEQRLGKTSRARLDVLRESLEQRRDLRALRERAEQSLSAEEQERLRRLRAQLRLAPEARAQLERLYQRLAVANLSNEPGGFAPGLSEREALRRAEAYLAEIARVAPFNAMFDRYALDQDEDGAERLCELILRETRLRTFRREGERRELIVRQGDYGSTAFLILEGRVRILLQSEAQARATAGALGSSATRRRGWLGLLARWLGASPGREVRRVLDARYAGVRPGDDPVPIVIPDFAKLPAQSREHTLGEGEVFGEIAALTRTPRTATVVPDTEEVRLLEVRWQGLRGLIEEDDAFQRHVEARYRDSSRRAYVFRLDLFEHVGDTEAIRQHIREGDPIGLFVQRLGWAAPRERPGWPATFRVPAAAPAPLRCRIALLQGGAVERVELAPGQERVRIGWGADNDLRLARRPTVSEQHAELRLVDGRWFLHNRSRHGTLLGGASVRTHTVLFPGAELAIGDAARLRLELAAEPAQPGAPELTLTLAAESPVHNGIGGVKAYLCALGDAPLPSEEVCAQVAEQVKRREYLRGEESRHVVVFTRRDPRQQDWRWLVPVHDAQEPVLGERSGHRYLGDPTPLVRGLIHSLALEEVVKATEFLSFGKFRWFERSPAEEQEGTHWAARLATQPLIASQGHYPNGVFMVRAGFARLTEQTDQGERTVSYLRPEAPYGYGLEEVIENFLAKLGDPSARGGVMLAHSLRAIGYADTVFFPASVFERFVLPGQRPEALRALLRRDRSSARAAPRGLQGLPVVPPGVSPDLRDFLVDHHLINGTQAMVINLDRCTRCDDCVRGCAATHERDPRFIRHGPVHGNLMVANACMHCVDPVCLIDCPTGAIHRPLGGGQVVIHDATCIGCGACAFNCPYDNIRMVTVRDSAERVVAARDEAGAPALPVQRATKCDLCYDQATRQPACVRACPHDALRRVDLSDIGALPGLARWLQ